MNSLNFTYKKNLTGFTLIEVLVALIILATVATLAVTGLQSVILSDKRQIEVTDQLAELQFAYLLMQRDISQTINRPILDSQNAWRPGLLGVGGLGARLMSDMALEGEILVEFTRAGGLNPQQLSDRTTLQRIAYVYDGKKLQRYEWLLVDRASASMGAVRTLLKEISEIRLTYFDEYGQKRSQWATELQHPPEWLNHYPASARLPAAMEWRFIHPRYGEIIWLFSRGDEKTNEKTQ